MPCSQMSAWMSSASSCQRSPRSWSSRRRARRAPRSQATQHMTFEEVKCCGSPRTSQIPRSGSRQAAIAWSTCLHEDLPRRLGQPVARLRVQVDRVQQRAPHVVLLLGVGAVADAHRLGVLVAVEVQQHLLGQRLLAADAVHDLQLVVGLRGDVADEVEEVVGLLVEAQRVEAPEHEGRVADPGVAVVPVALAAGRLGQRRGRRRDHRAGRRVGQPLERQRAALQVGAPRMVGELAVAEPLVPVVGGEDEAVVGVVVGLRAAVVAPRQRDERGVAVAQGRARAGAPALEADAQVGAQRQLRGPRPRRVPTALP